MLYGESSYTGPNHLGQTFKAHCFHNIIED